MNQDNSEKLYEEAKELIPGGVNSPVRAFQSVGGTPPFIQRGEGPYMFDEDDNKFIDYMLSWGPLILGHAHPAVTDALEEALQKGTSFGAPTKMENTLAKLVIDTVPSIDQIRFVNSGTEACMSAIRLARSYTGKDKIIKFAGNYHGHADYLLVAAGSGVATLGLPDSPGVPKDSTKNTLVAPYNDIEAVKKLFEQHSGEIAGAIIEPIAANMGFVKPEREYLKELIEICHTNDAVTIMDEVMTGFRVSPGGAQEAYNLDPDITCLGKVIGGGLPVGAYAGKADIMEEVAPVGDMYQAGTLSGNPLAMTAGYATISEYLNRDLHSEMSNYTKNLIEGIEEVASDLDIPLQSGYQGSMFGFYFLNDDDLYIRNYNTAKEFSDDDRYSNFFHAMLDKGIYFSPSHYEAGFVSAVHTEDNLNYTLSSIEKVLRQ